MQYFYFVSVEKKKKKKKKTIQNTICSRCSLRMNDKNASNIQVQNRVHLYKMLILKQNRKY